MIRTLRPSEWLSLAFFVYVAAIAPFFHDRPFLGLQPVAVLLAVIAIYASLILGERKISIAAFSITRDWIPIAITLIAFREMDLFRPSHFSGRLEAGWIQWDILLLLDWRLRDAIEFFGPVVPWFLEICYFLVYGIAAFGVWALYASGERRLVDRFFLLYFAGTLGSYALFPFIPSEPPRFVYPDVGAPHVWSAIRTLNYLLLRGATIHMSVFPSAHVSSAFSAAWAILLLLPKRRMLGYIFLGYAISVALATVYGRYHYAPDALAGVAVSVAAAGVYMAYHRSP